MARLSARKTRLPVGHNKVDKNADAVTVQDSGIADAEIPTAFSLVENSVGEMFPLGGEGEVRGYIARFIDKRGRYPYLIVYKAGLGLPELVDNIPCRAARSLQGVLLI